MHKLRFVLALIVGLLPMFWMFLSDASAGCDWWFNFSNQCDIQPPYCPNQNDCSIDKWVDVTGKLTNGLITQKPISEYAQDIIKYLMSFISIIAVIYIIYAGFSVMIGWGDEEKSEKSKNINSST